MTSGLSWLRAIALIVILLLALVSCGGPSPQPESVQPLLPKSELEKETGVNVIATQDLGFQEVPDEPAASEKAESEPTVGVIVSRNFGSEVVLDKLAVLAEGESALEVLQRLTTVETKYGGGFVAGINGICSEYPKVRKDWFFYVNGIMGNVGAGSYKLRPDDIEQWDFHGWDFNAFVPAIIGSFPQPFLSGYGGKVQPTVIVYEEGFGEAAEKLRDTIARLGVEGISLQPSLSDPEREQCHLILVGTADFEPIAELNKNYRKLGFLLKFKDDGAVIFDAHGKETRIASCGVIQATQNPWNPKGIGAAENTAWVISGTDQAHVRDAVDALINQPDMLRCAFAVALIDGKVVKLPAE